MLYYINSAIIHQCYIIRLSNVQSEMKMNRPRPAYSKLGREIIMKTHLYQHALYGDG